MNAKTEELANRIKKNYKRLKSWAEREHIEAYRIYDRDLPNFPFAIDLYGPAKKPFVVIQDRRRDIDYTPEYDKLEELKQFLSAEFKPEDIIVKVRKPQREGGNKTQQYEKAADTGHGLWVTEGKARFLVNLYDYLDTGLFLDHRKLRYSIFKQIELGDSFLNLFSYTASASVWAALAGAQTRSVDLSNTYMSWAKANFKGNELDPEHHEFIVDDALAYLSGPVDKTFDCIFLDPPTFSNSKSLRRDFEVGEDHVELIRKTCRWLGPNGRLIFSCNKRDFKLSEEIKAQYQVKDLGQETLPMDFKDPKTRKAFLIRHSVKS